MGVAEDYPIDLAAGATGPKTLRKKVLMEGNGPQAARGEQVFCHYRGCLSTNHPKEPFDCSCPKPHRQNGFNFTIGEKQVITGWELGLASMKVGEVAEFYIGSEFGYGAGGGGPIPPNADLVFEIELLHKGPEPDPTVAERSNLKKKYPQG